MSFASIAFAAQDVKEVAIGLNDVYVPAGFSSQQEAYVVVSGLFPNGCYSWSRAQVQHLDDYSHQITSYANVSQGMCVMVLVPFTKEVRLGPLASGKHRLRFLNGDGTYLEKSLKIE